MMNEIKPENLPAARAKSISDLSEAIESSVERATGEEVRSVRVFDDNYRCNWWVRDAGLGPAYLNIGRIIKSRFLRVTMNGEKLVIEDLSRIRPR